MSANKASNYSVFVVGENRMRVSIRVSNHHANSRKYLEHEPNDFNLSVMVSKRYRKNTFQADSGVVLKEFVYMGRQLETVESPFSQIATSLAQFLEMGEYVDTTGVAKVNVSPAPTTFLPTQGGGISPSCKGTPPEMRLQTKLTIDD